MGQKTRGYEARRVGNTLCVTPIKSSSTKGGQVLFSKNLEEGRLEKKGGNKEERWGWVNAPGLH